MMPHCVQIYIVRRTNILVGAESHPATNMPKHTLGQTCTQHSSLTFISSHKHRGRPVCASRVSHFWTPFWTPLLGPDDSCIPNPCAAATMSSTSAECMQTPTHVESGARTYTCRHQHSPRCGAQTQPKGRQLYATQLMTGICHCSVLAVQKHASYFWNC